MKTNNTSKRFLFAALALTALAAGGSAAAAGGFSFDTPSALPPLPEPPPAAITAVRAATLDQAAAAAIKAVAGQPDSDLGPVNGGNLGLSAYRLGPDAANRAARLAKQAFPGIAPGNAAYSAAGPQLILVITSEDEPYVYLYNQDPAAGRLKALGYFNIVDAVEAFYADPQLAALAAGYADWDWAGVLDGLAGKGIGAPIALGPGSARSWWWSAAGKRSPRAAGQINARGTLYAYNRATRQFDLPTGRACALTLRNFKTYTDTDHGSPREVISASYILEGFDEPGNYAAGTAVGSAPTPYTPYVSLQNYLQAGLAKGINVQIFTPNAASAQDLTEGRARPESVHVTRENSASSYFGGDGVKWGYFCDLR